MPRAWHLKSRPSGLPTSDNFEFKDIALPELGQREVGLKVEVAWRLRNQQQAAGLSADGAANIHFPLAREGLGC